MNRSLFAENGYIFKFTNVINKWIIQLPTRNLNKANIKEKGNDSDFIYILLCSDKEGANRVREKVKDFDVKRMN